MLIGDKEEIDILRQAEGFIYHLNKSDLNQRIYEKLHYERIKMMYPVEVELA